MSAQMADGGSWRGISDWMRRVALKVRGPEIAKEKRWKPYVYMNIVCVSLMVLIPVTTGIVDNYRIGLNGQTEELRCIEGKAFLLTKARVVRPERDGLYAYTSLGLGEILPDGTGIIKIAAGLPGDVVRVDATGIYINQTFWGPLNPITMAKTATKVSTVTKQYVIGDGQVLMLGTRPRSYDGRYLGPIETRRLIANVERLW